MYEARKFCAQFGGGGIQKVKVSSCFDGEKG